MYPNIIIPYYPMVSHELPKKITCESHEIPYKSFLSVLSPMDSHKKIIQSPFSPTICTWPVTSLGPPLKPRRGSVPPRQRHLLPRAALVRSLGLGAADAAAGGAVLSHGLLLGVRS